MKKHLIFILLLALPFISKSQIVAKQVKLSIQNNTLIAVDNSNNGGSTGNDAASISNSWFTITEINNTY